jgi:hypothetical protein
MQSFRGPMRRPPASKPPFAKYSPVTTCCKRQAKLLILSCLSELSPVCFPAQWLLALETARRVDCRSCPANRASTCRAVVQARSKLL